MTVITFKRFEIRTREYAEQVAYAQSLGAGRLECDPDSVLTIRTDRGTDAFGHPVIGVFADNMRVAEVHQHP
jgi:hypothetical protein